MTYVLDASVTLAWCFEDEGGWYAEAALDALRHGEAFVAPHWPLEVSNGLLVAERRGRIEGPEATRVLRLLLALPIVVEPVERARTMGEAHRLARGRGLSAYDGAYLELALRRGLPLATLDEELRAAARDEAVDLFEPEAGG